METSEPQARTGYRDTKGFIRKKYDNGAFRPFFKSIEESFKNGEIVKLDQLLNEMENEKINEDKKKELCIIQFGFVIINKNDEVLVISRMEDHIITKGASIVCSFSPDKEPEAKRCSYLPDYIKGYYERVIKCDMEPSSVDFLAVIRNTKKEKDYIFYIFKVKYDVDKAFIKESLTILDSSDKPKDFFDIRKKGLIDQMEEKEVDLRVIDILCVGNSDEKPKYEYKTSKIVINPGKNMESLYSFNIEDCDYPGSFQAARRIVKRTKKWKDGLHFVIIALPLFILIVGKIIDLFSLNFASLLFYLVVLSIMICSLIQAFLPKMDKYFEKKFLQYGGIANDIRDNAWKYMTRTDPYNKCAEDEADKKFTTSVERVIKIKLGEDGELYDSKSPAKEFTDYMTDIRKQSFSARKFFYGKYLESEKGHYDRELTNNINLTIFFKACLFVYFFIVVYGFSILSVHPKPPIADRLEYILFFIPLILSLGDYKKYPDLVETNKSAIRTLEGLIRKFENHINSGDELSNFVIEANDALRGYAR